jgi:hypothetical protein
MFFAGVDFHVPLKHIYGRYCPLVERLLDRSQGRYAGGALRAHLEATAGAVVLKIPKLRSLTFETAIIKRLLGWPKVRKRTSEAGAAFWGI